MEGLLKNMNHHPCIFRFIATCAMLLASGLIIKAAWADDFPTPLDYGAAGDGLTDDTAALQRALDSGKVIHLASGKYRINSSLTPPEGGGLLGPGTIVSGTEMNAFILVNRNSVTLQNFNIQKEFKDGSYSSGILAEHVQKLKVFNLDIVGFSARYGIHLIECEDFKITGCHIHGFMMNTTADMIQDSPAGLRVTRSRKGIVSNNRVLNIEVGETGRNSISPLVPAYGKQGYQSDCMTIQECSDIVINGNLLATSGEGLDLLLSEKCAVSNNLATDIWNEGIKLLGVSFCALNGNHLSDCHLGMGLANHPSQGKEASGNVIAGNVFHNMGSPGSFGAPSSQREKVNPVGSHGISLGTEQGCRFNLITNNIIVDTQAQKTTQSGIRTNGDATNQLVENLFTLEILAP